MRYIKFQIPFFIDVEHCLLLGECATIQKEIAITKGRDAGLRLNLNTQILEYALEISRCGSISRAAQNLFLSQPNLSTNIKALEESLGFRIFTRSSKGIMPTPEGEMFLKSAEIIVSEMANIRRIPELCNPDRSEGLSVVCAYSSYILDLTIQFIQLSEWKFPQNTFKETGLNHMLEDIIAKDYRLGFFYDFECNHHKRQKLAERYFLDLNLLKRNIPVVAMISKNHPLANRQSVSVEELRDYPLVVYEDFAYDDWLGPIGIDRHASVLYIFDRGGMLETLRSSGGVGIATGHAWGPRDIRDAIEIPVTGTRSVLNQYWIKASDCRLGSFERQFIDFLKAEFEK